MQQKSSTRTLMIIGIVINLLLVTALIAGCTSTSTAPATPSATAAPVSTPAALETAAPTLVVTTAAPAATKEAVKPTSTPKPVYTYSEGNVVAYTAASLSGVSPKLAEGFEKMYPGHKVVFNLAGTQALKTQVQNGAYCDVFISASNSYTNELTKGGYFVSGTVKPLTSNYVIVILPKDNPANIRSLSDLAKKGVKIAVADKSVPVGTATTSVIANLAKSANYGKEWNSSVYGNIVTYETSEPAVAGKVELGEVDAGFVYESTYIAGKDKFVAISVPKAINYLQTYTIGVMKDSTSKGAAADFETFMLSADGQQILEDYGFRPL
ncbi:molybdate ABC transporter substrate-binding protein [Methanoregula formicica]|uniref:Molybdenum ABC transporter, periplasmic molybdate-binding protein n=1 Tax=Methanoregula formicica (strain DSM 22288 / NBRC 105244 / SMSP) TaxID=593750 RepID=L0HF94_METFS|nr:molybdate ABC transporter substrate-binding protein [Methanoregula formicica]AGB01749.1 molybdenum ABC transporter, periplasmic molybdate-binding protein [Methanoregula formicica SMSP]